VRKTTLLLVRNTTLFCSTTPVSFGEKDNGEKTISQGDRGRARRLGGELRASEAGVGGSGLGFGASGFQGFGFWVKGLGLRV